MTYRVEPWPRWLGKIPSDDPADPRPFLLPGVRVQFAQPTRSIKRRAKAEAVQLLGEVEEGGTRDLIELTDAGDAFSEALLRKTIIAWEGIGDPTGAPLPVGPEAIELFLGDERLFDAADAALVMPEVLLDAEKNGLSASPNGTGEAATPASDIATSPAPAKTAAPNAPTSSKPRRAKRAKTPGS